MLHEAITFQLKIFIFNRRNHSLFSTSFSPFTLVVHSFYYFKNLQIWSIFSFFFLNIFYEISFLLVSYFWQELFNANKGGSMISKPTAKFVESIFFNTAIKYGKLRISFCFLSLFFFSLSWKNWVKISPLGPVKTGWKKDPNFCLLLLRRKSKVF